MKMLTLEDRTGTYEATLFPRIYAKFAPRTLTRGPYLVIGEIDVALGSPTLNVRHIELLSTKPGVSTMGRKISCNELHQCGAVNHLSATV